MILFYRLVSFLNLLVDDALIGFGRRVRVTGRKYYASRHDAITDVLTAPPSRLGRLPYAYRRSLSLRLGNLAGRYREWGARTQREPADFRRFAWRAPELQESRPRYHVWRAS